jgi:hypothetical protein
LGRNEPVVINIDPRLVSSRGDINAGSRQATRLHAVLVIGSRRKDGECQYLLRNSWGKNACARGKGEAVECDNGNYWVSQRTLERRLDKVHQFVVTMPSGNESAPQPSAIQPTARQ